jgi:hypothetical protein
MMVKIARLPKKANLAGAKDAKLWVSIGNSIAVKDCQATEECFPKKALRKGKPDENQGRKVMDLKLNMEGMINQGCQTTEKANPVKIGDAKSRI